MKIRVLLLLLALGHGLSGGVLLTSRRSREAPHARKLLVYPGFNEVEATESYKKELRGLIDRVQTLRRKLEAFGQQTSRDVNAVTQRLDAQTDHNALDVMLNNLFLETQQAMQNPDHSNIRR